MKTLAWQDIKVLSVWDSATASNFGHVVLQPNHTAPPPMSGGPVAGSPTFPPTMGPTSQLAPPPLSDGSSSPGTSQMVGEPTMFDNCVALSPAFRVRWTLGVTPGTVDIGLESALTKTQYMAFGWAKPGITGNYMIGADVVVAGIDDKVQFYLLPISYSRTTEIEFLIRESFLTVITFVAPLRSLQVLRFF